MHVVVGGGGTPDKHGALKVVFQLFSGEYLFTQWFRVSTQWLCVLMRGGGHLINMGL